MHADSEKGPAAGDTVSSSSSVHLDTLNAINAKSSFMDKLPPWISAALRSKRAWKTFLRCWFATWVSFLLMMPERSVNTMGFACVVFSSANCIRVAYRFASPQGLLLDACQCHYTRHVPSAVLLLREYLHYLLSERMLDAIQVLCLHSAGRSRGAMAAARHCGVFGRHVRICTRRCRPADLSYPNYPFPAVYGLARALHFPWQLHIQFT